MNSFDVLIDGGRTVKPKREKDNVCKEWDQVK